MQPEERKQVLETLSLRETEAILYDWGVWARDDQIAPPGEWDQWVLLAGRGAGKTRSGAEWIRGKVKDGAGKIALVAPTAADTRDVMVEGDSGLLSVCWKHDKDRWGRPTGRPLYEPSKRRLTWENGAYALLFSAEEPERLRGPQFHAAWTDELAAWKYLQDTWDMLSFGLRLGLNPQTVVTTTPKPLPLLKQILKDPGTKISRASTFANMANLAPRFLARIKAKYEGTRLGRQELYAAIIDDIAGALWQRDQIEKNRLRLRVVGKEVFRDWPDLARVVVSVDPATTAQENSDETGIIVQGRGVDKRGYVLDDLSGIMSPGEWGEAVVLAYWRNDADCVIYESNQGGDMVRHTIQVAAQKLHREGKIRSAEIPCRGVHSYRGKVLRAEPISALYEQGRISHVGGFPTLEDQMCSFTLDFDRKVMGSPDRVDALVHGFTDLLTDLIEIPLVDPFSAEGLSKWRPGVG